MNLHTLLWRSLTYYRRTHLAVLAGVATAVAVLAGALLVGDSVRGSLRELVLGRLGNTDAVVAGTNFFRAALAREMGGYGMIALEGVVAHGQTNRAASKVAIYGVDEGFWKFHDVTSYGEAPAARAVRLSPALAEELAAAEGDSLVVRLGRPSEIPLESLHGRKDESVRTIRVTAGKVLPPEAMGEFALRPQQGSVRALFVSLQRLQRELQQNGKTNLLLLSDAGGAEKQLRKQATLEDLSVRVKALPRQGQLSLESASMVVNDALAQAGREAAQELGLTAQPVLTYLVNSMRIGAREVPYSLVTAVDMDGLGGDAVVLNRWAADDLGAKPGDALQMEYFVWLEGRVETRRSEWKVARIIPMEGPAADRDYAPEYPGITEAKTIHDWDPPFPMDLGKIRKRDEDYWNTWRTTPKAFIAFPAGQKIWGTRFGEMTSLRIALPAGASVQEMATRYQQALRNRLEPSRMGLALMPVRAAGLAASQGATDFGQYFLYFSFFLVVSALLLVGLFFRLGVEQRYREAGLLRALGFPIQRLAELFLKEGALLAGAGAVLGMLAAAVYAGVILYGLRTWWVDAVGTRLLRLHLGPVSLLGGALGGFLTALAVIYFTVRALARPSPRTLLQGSVTAAETAQGARRALWIAVGGAVAGLLILCAAVAGRIDAAGGFFGAGGLLLIAALAAQRVWLGHGVSEPSSLWRLGMRNATYRPGRSVLSIALIGFATFLIIALTAFRQEGASADPAKRPGTGGFALIGESVLPVIHNPGSAAGRAELAFPADSEALFAGARVLPLRMRPGDDSSCLNLYQPTNPRVVGLPHELIQTAKFPLAGSASWAMLEQSPADGTVPAFVDANSLQYVLHKTIGDEIVLNTEAGKPVRLKIAGALRDSVFQGEVLIADAHFTRAFPEQQGYRMFLVEAPAARTAAISDLMEDRLRDFGADFKGTVERLAEFHRVENAYLSTFQSLGGLGLLLGTVGLAAVLLRNVLERRKELALLRAVGFRPQQLARLVLAENTLLLASGLLVGTLCAALAIAPALAERGTKLPLVAMAALIAAVFVTGMVASLAAVKAALKSPLLQSLRSE